MMRTGMMIVMTALALMAQPAEAERSDAAWVDEAAAAVSRDYAIKDIAGPAPAGAVGSVPNWPEPSEAAAQESEIIMHGGGHGTSSTPFEFSAYGAKPER